MWSFRTVARYVLVTLVAAAAGPVPGVRFADGSFNHTAYYKPLSRNSLKDNITSNIERSRNVEKEELLSKMSSLNPKFWVNAHLPNPKVDPAWDSYSDCFYKSRKVMRPYPKDSMANEYCYTLDFNTRREDAWWNFWPEIRGDLQYVFDFVMWDEYEQYHETNSFWYLMLYLKTLLSYIPDPNMVANVDFWRKNPYATIPPPDFFENGLLRELLTEYELKLQHLHSLI